MSKAPETIYIDLESDEKFPRVLAPGDERFGHEIGYIHPRVAYGYACEVERLKEDAISDDRTITRLSNDVRLLGHACLEHETRIVHLKESLTNLMRKASVMTAHQIETMARDALEGK